MKNNYYIKNAAISLLTWSLFVISCNNSSNEKPPLTSQYLKEAPLPQGIAVIEDEPRLPVNDVNIIALGKDAPKKDQPDVAVAPTRLDKLKKNYKNLLIFHADDTMEVNAPKLATLVLSREGNIDQLKMEVLEMSNAGDSNIKSDMDMEFGTKMKARLISFGSNGENSFSIESLGDDIQSFKTDRKKILWQWKITPLKPGQQELKLSVQIIERDGESVSLPARNIPVIIFAKSESFFSKAGSFIANKFEFILTAIFVPLLIAWYTTRRRNKIPQPPTNNTGQV